MNQVAGCNLRGISRMLPYKGVNRLSRSNKHHQLDLQHMHNLELAGGHPYGDQPPKHWPLTRKGSGRDRVKSGDRARVGAEGVEVGYRVNRVFRDNHYRKRLGLEPISAEPRPIPTPPPPS